MENDWIAMNRNALIKQEEEREKRFKILREENVKRGFVIPELTTNYKAWLIGRMDELRKTGDEPFELGRISKILYPSFVDNKKTI